jgi:hypothetical protein
MLEGAEGSALVGNSILLGPSGHRKLCMGRDIAIHRQTGARVYHLMASPAMLFNPAVIFSAGRAAVRGMPEVNPRPRALNALAAHRSG